MPDNETPPTEPSRRGMDRRTMIKAAAAAGATAWTAPIIIDSLASPAAAATVSGCHSLAVLPGACTVTQADPGGSCVAPTNYNSVTCPQEPAGTALSTWCITASTCSATAGAVFTIGAGCPSCTFTGGQGTGGNGSSNNSCTAGVVSGAGKTLTIGAGTGTFKNFRLVVSC